MTINKLYERVKAVNTEKVIINAIDTTTDDLKEVNKERINDGVLKDGKVLPNYSYTSQKVYGYPNIPIRLLDTGAFQRGLFVKREGGRIVTGSTDSKSAMLEERYGLENGSSIFGLGGSYKQQYLDESLRPAFKLGMEAATGLKFSK